ncbi:MAG: hypothetical protein KGR18_11265 [Acidobacteria bacterium]|nr:hypothetical protein [Acidobacteriota bacterium]
MSHASETSSESALMNHEYDSAFVITWRSPFPGREAAALTCAAEPDTRWSKLTTDGLCSTPEWLFHPSGWGMWMVRGLHAELDHLVQEDESRMLIARGTLLLDGFQYAIAPAGRGADRYVNNDAAVASEAGVI